MINENRYKMTVEERDRLIETVEQVMTIGHGEVVVKITDHNPVFCEGKFQYQFNINGGKK